MGKDMLTWNQDLEIFIYSLRDFPEGHLKLDKALKLMWGMLRGKEPVDKMSLSRFAKMFFESGKGVYVGIESCLPSRFMDIYPSWLDNHAAYAKNLTADEKKQSGRILVVNTYHELYNDPYTNPDNFSEFMKRHENNVLGGLYYVVRDRAEEIAKRHKLIATDVAFWREKYAVFFIHGKKTVKIRLVKKDDKMFDNVRKYTKEILGIAKKIRKEDLSLMDPELAVNWKGYTGSTEDRKHIHRFIGELLKNFANRSGRILDVAGAIGNEGIYLLKEGFDVAINEVDPSLYSVLKENITNSKDLKRKGITFDKLDVYKMDWRKMSEAKIVHGSIKAILLLGNSLSMVKPKEHISICLDQFSKLLSPGGMLIVDERNFPKILKGLKSRKKVTGESVMFPSTEVYSTLRHKGKDGEIIFDFFKNGRKLGDIGVTYLAKGELERMLEDANFEIINTYSDLKLSTPPSPNADFYTYVAVKPKKKFVQKQKLIPAKKKIKAPTKKTTERVRSGLANLDEMLLGGLAKNSSVALTSPSCDERDLIIKTFLETGVKNDETAFYFTIDHRNVKSLVKNFRSKFVLFICNPMADSMVEDAANIFKFKGVENLTDINIALKAALRQLNKSTRGPRRACIDIITDILSQHNASRARKWLNAIISELKSNEFTILVPLDPEMHTPRDVRSIIDILDGEINIYEEETEKGLEKFLRIKKMIGQDFQKRRKPLKNWRNEK